MGNEFLFFRIILILIVIIYSMKRLFLIKNPCVFQGEKYLELNKDYFEGWYFKNTNNKISISFIPGININKSKRYAFIQVITDNSSYYVDYDIKEFEYGYDPFYIRIGNNYFSKDSIKVDISCDNLTIKGELNYSDSININTSNSSPNIMGIFSYVPFMECNHAVISMKNKINGSINISGKEFIFKDGYGYGYIEKDWGYSFPDSYIWLQGNNFSSNSKVAFMMSIANIPFKIFNFRGLICSLIIDNYEYRFATYNGSKILKYNIDNNKIDITIKKGNYYLDVTGNLDKGNSLKAPVNGSMEKDIIESISSIIKVTLRKDNEILFSDSSNNCGLEIVK